VIGLLQRVRWASVTIGAEPVAAIDHGLLVLVGVEANDQPASAGRLLDRLVHYRVFADADGRMNRSLLQTGGGLLLVPQFTLAADTRKGRRPGFSRAAAPEQGRQLFTLLLDAAACLPLPVGAGRFGADMLVASCNDGPVTFWLQTA
jgi:D-aminoacyl-tRNA deacylase